MLIHETGDLGEIVPHKGPEIIHPLDEGEAELVIRAGRNRLGLRKAALVGFPERLAQERPVMGGDRVGGSGHRDKKKADPEKPGSKPVHKSTQLAHATPGI
jgi:hypothetical protein